MPTPSKYIPLVNGGRARVDADDYEKLAKHKWFRSSEGYAYRQGWSGPRNDSSNHWTIWMHRVVNRTPDGKISDHKNQKKRDNRKCNLRTVDKSRDSANRHKAKRKVLTSEFKGVSYHPSTGLWRARIRDRSYERTTYHSTERKAALDYNRMALERFGENACANKLSGRIAPTVPRIKSSRFRGVSLTPYGKWRAAIEHKGKVLSLGNHDTEIEAALAYNKAAVDLDGARANLNAI